MRGGIREAGDKEWGWNRKSWRQRMRGGIGKAGDKEWGVE